MFSTAEPLVINILFTVLAVWATLLPLGVLFYCKRLILRDFPGRRTINDLRIEVSDFSGMVADLTDRFNRFQKREGMRSARAEKEHEKSVLEQAKEIAAQADAEDLSGATSDKLDLYKRARH